jgi:hypothetical protein
VQYQNYGGFEMKTRKSALTMTMVVFVAILSFGLVAFTYVDLADAALPERHGPPDNPGQPANGQNGGIGASGSGSYGIYNGTYAGVYAELTAAEEAALIAAIEEEYGARALYEGVAAQFDDAALFSRIARSERQHAAALIRQAQKYGLDVPDYPGPLSTEFESLADACLAGVDAEIADAALYDELLMDTDKADLIRVFERLQAASLQSHLPAFETCQ